MGWLLFLWAIYATYKAWKYYRCTKVQTVRVETLMAAGITANGAKVFGAHWFHQLDNRTVSDTKQIYAYLREYYGIPKPDHEWDDPEQVRAAIIDALEKAEPAIRNRNARSEEADTIS